MRAAFLYGARDVRVENVETPTILGPHDAVVRVTAAGICGSDLPMYRTAEPRDHGEALGHEFVGVVEQLGDEHGDLRIADTVIAPFGWSDGSCPACQEGLTSSCRNGGLWGGTGGGGQAEAVRVPFASSTLVRVERPDDAPLASLLALCDVYPTGFHAATMAGVDATTTVVVIGDGAVGLLSVLAARRLGATHIVLVARHSERAGIADAFGATDIVGNVDDAAGSDSAIRDAIALVRDGGTISRAGIPARAHTHGESMTLFMRNVSVIGGLTPVRRHLPTLLPSVLAGEVVPGRVFDLELPLSAAAVGYEAMDQRVATKVMLRAG